MGCKGRTPSCFSLLSSKSIASAEEIATHLRGPELIESVSWSPDASRLVYSKEGRIYLYSFGLDQSTLLTEGTGVSWSPDGAWIAFIHDGNIDLISPQGGPVRTLIENATQAEPVKWSPDSAYALASYYSAHFTAGLQELGRVEVIRISDGAELTLIYPDATGILCMEWIKTE
jgi:Tol biopolymer transport system component